MIGAVTSLGPRAPLDVTSGAATGGTPAALLPPAEATGAAEAFDAIAALWTAVSRDQSGARVRDEANVRSGEAHAAAVLHDEIDALARERANEPHGGGFLDDIGRIFDDVVRDASRGRFTDMLQDADRDLKAAWDDPQLWRDLESAAGTIAHVASYVGAAIVGAVAIVGTAGTGAPFVLAIAAVALSAGGAAVSETKCFGESSRWIGLGMCVAGGLGSGLLTALGQTSAMAASGALSAAGSAANGAGGVAEATSAGAHARSGVFEGNAEEAHADARAAETELARIHAGAAALTAAFGEASASARRAFESLRGMTESESAARTCAAGGRC